MGSLERGNCSIDIVRDLVELMRDTNLQTQGKQQTQGKIFLNWHLVANKIPKQTENLSSQRKKRLPTKEKQTDSEFPDSANGSQKRVKYFL